MALLRSPAIKSLDWIAADITMYDIIRSWYFRHFSDPQAVILVLGLVIVFTIVLLLGGILGHNVHSLVHTSWYSRSKIPVLARIRSFTATVHYLARGNLLP